MNRTIVFLGSLTMVMIAAGIAAMMLFASAPGPALQSRIDLLPLPADPEVFRSVILITIDTLRGDHPGFSGNPNVRSPNLDRLAKHSLVFTDAITNYPLTLPAHSAMMTSRYPRELGLESNARPLDPGFKTIAQMLQAEGFATAGYPQAVLQFRRGIERGFDVYRSPILRKANTPRQSTFEIKKNPSLLQYQKQETRTEDDQNNAVREAIDWLGRMAILDRRIFMWMHFFEPHLPYDAVEPIRYIDQTDTRDFIGEVTHKNARMLLTPGLPFDDDENRVNHHLYRNEILWTDIKIDPLFRAIRRSLDPDPLIIVTSDHGEMLYDRYPYYGHGMQISPEELHIPFFVYDGGRTAGIISDRMVQSVDVAATILAAAGFPQPPDYRGRDVRVPDPGGTRAAPFNVAGSPGWIGAADMMFKVAMNREFGTWMYWNRQSDPDERRGLPLNDTSPVRVRELQRIALEYMAVTAENASHPAPENDDPQFTDMLRSLGYLQ